MAPAIIDIDDRLVGVQSPQAERLEDALDEEEDLAVIPIIITEVLQGFRTDTEAELLSPDADFRHFTRHTSLRLWRA